MKKSILVLGLLASLVMLVGCASSNNVVYDEIIPGDGKSPVKLQLKNGEYVEADWTYPQYYRTINWSNQITFNWSSDEWQQCDTGKECYLVLNYNPNDGYYDIGTNKKAGGKYNKKKFRPYTVEELGKLIGATPYSDCEDSWKYFGPELKISEGENTMICKIYNSTDHPLKVQEFIQEKEIIAHTKEIEIPINSFYTFKHSVNDIMSLCNDSSVDSVMFVFEYQIQDKYWYRGGTQTLEKSFLKNIKGSFNYRNITVMDNGNGSYMGNVL